MRWYASAITLGYCAVHVLTKTLFTITAWLYTGTSTDAVIWVGCSTFWLRLYQWLLYLWLFCIAHIGNCQWFHILRSSCIQGWRFDSGTKNYSYSNANQWIPLLFLQLGFLDEISFCLFENATALDVLAFSYVTMIYTFVLIVLVIIIKRKCTIRCKPRGPFRSSNYTLQGSIIHGLSSFLILFFSHCVNNSILILYLYGKGPNTQPKPIVRYNGEIIWMSHDHLPHAIPAIIMLIAVLTPTQFTTKYYQLWRYQNLDVFNLLERLKPFFDSFQGSFKDKCRFFSGFYFI